jgi:hypothetical protein
LWQRQGLAAMRIRVAEWFDTDENIERSLTATLDVRHIASP